MVHMISIKSLLVHFIHVDLLDYFIRSNEFINERKSMLSVLCVSIFATDLYSAWPLLFSILNCSVFIFRIQYVQ